MESHFKTISDQKIVFGNSCCKKELADLFRKADKIAFFTGAASADLCGATDFVENTAAECGSEIFRWSGVIPEPDIETVLKMRDFLADLKPDLVCAVGGGSVLDAAKAALLLIETGWDIDDLFGVNSYSSKNPEKSLRRIVAIPTTCGTGSESTQYSNIVDRTNQVKRLIAEREIVPQCALVNPDFITSLPDSVIRATACDALAHLIEGLLNVGADAASGTANYRAIAGIRLIVENLPRRLNDPTDRKAETALAGAATLGGTVIRFKSTGLPHLCSFSWFGRIAHGDAVAVLLQECWRYYLANPAVAARTMELADIFSGSTPDEVISSYESLLDSVGMPGGLSAWQGIDAELIEKTARSGAENKMKLELAPQPVPLDKSFEILRAILKLSL